MTTDEKSTDVCGDCGRPRAYTAEAWENSSIGERDRVCAKNIASCGWHDEALIDCRGLTIAKLRAEVESLRARVGEPAWKPILVGDILQVDEGFNFGH